MKTSEIIITVILVLLSIALFSSLFAGNLNKIMQGVFNSRPKLTDTEMKDYFQVSWDRMKEVLEGNQQRCLFEFFPNFPNTFNPGVTYWLYQDQRTTELDSVLVYGPSKSEFETYDLADLQFMILKTKEFVPHGHSSFVTKFAELVALEDLNTQGKDRKIMINWDSTPPLIHNSQNINILGATKSGFAKLYLISGYALKDGVSLIFFVSPEKEIAESIEDLGNIETVLCS